MDIFGTVLALCQGVASMAEALQANKDECDNLAQLAAMAMPVVQKLKEKYQSCLVLDKNIEMYLNNLKEALMNSRKLVQKMKGNRLKMLGRKGEFQSARIRIQDILNCLSAYGNIDAAGTSSAKQGTSTGSKGHNIPISQRRGPANRGHVSIVHRPEPANRGHASAVHQPEPANRGHASTVHRLEPGNHGHTSTLHQPEPANRGYPFTMHQPKPANRGHVSKQQIQLNTDLLKAAESGDIKQVKNYLQRGAQVSARNCSGQTPLHLAANSGKTDVVKLLLRSGANANLQDYRGSTALHLSSYWAYISTSKALIDAGARLDLINNDGKVPKTCITFGDTAGMMALLLGRNN